MHNIENTREHRYEMASAMLHAIGDENLDQAEALLEQLRQLNGCSTEHPDILTFRAMIAIQRGQAMDALRYLNTLDGDPCPDVRAVCLFFCKDPTWIGLARECSENSPHEHIRRSMSLLLKVVTS
jgi:hypothetical protein